ncbi:hypothetical protein GHT09_007332 [Marmota monax]|uniref:Uncharacterized protein n=1 Tax=Marmota monax TaxID=9995 RepID=A0A834QMZ7_MARMO|nr:hypothetical protein GHT09_007332 [Marmota monax]
MKAAHGAQQPATCKTREGLGLPRSQENVQREGTKVAPKGQFSVKSPVQSEVTGFPITDGSIIRSSFDFNLEPIGTGQCNARESSSVEMKWVCPVGQTWAQPCAWTLAPGENSSFSKLYRDACGSQLSLHNEKL